VVQKSECRYFVEWQNARINFLYLFVISRIVSMKLTYKWCECNAVEPENVGEITFGGSLKTTHDIIYASDNQCICGVGKHHYHCSTCGGIDQVG